MVDRFSRIICPIDELPCWKFYLRLLWVAAQLMAAYALAKPNNPFFYQMF